MEYCPFCSGKLTKPVPTCPHCKKSLDLDIYQNIFQPSETSRENKSARRRLWFKENSRFIIPVIFLIIGLVAGAVLMFGYSTVYFQAKKSGYEKEITKLNDTIANSGTQVQNIQDSLNTQIMHQDSVITILAEQKKLSHQIIAFTRRMSNNSTVAANSGNEQDYFRRNFRYLERLYNAEQDKLNTIKFEDGEAPNLQTIPVFLGE